MIETKQLSFEDIKPSRKTKYIQILEILGNKKMTAREIELEMNRKNYSSYFDMNHVRPRLTELVKEYELVEECGTKEDSLTKKKVTIYKKKWVIKMELTAEEILKVMKSFFEGIDIEHSNLLQELSDKEAEQQDLLHELELNNLNAVEITKVAIDLKKVRKERRTIKNDIERVKTIKSFTDKYNNKFITNEIKALIKELYKLEKRQSNRQYEPRILKDKKIGEKNEK